MDFTDTGTTDVQGFKLEYKEITQNELRATGIRVGLLINFGRIKVELQRLVS
jgi:hypothetical protein